LVEIDLFIQHSGEKKESFLGSVLDPDPHVFGPPGSESNTVVGGTDPAPDPSIIKENRKKILIPIVL
jgi:hypothetical protein